MFDPLWNLRPDADDLPPEPQPCEGSMLHALKRILPMLAAHVGKSSATAHRGHVMVSDASETRAAPRASGVDNIVLHIGLPKTGSTALQNWARANSNPLATEGIFVLPTVLEAHRLAVECITNEKRLQAPDILNIKSLSFDAARRALIEGASREGVRASVVSSEYFFVADPARVAAMFAGMGVGVSRVVCFVRRQDDLLASGYNQDIKALGHARAFVPPPAYLRIYDWCALREDWQRAFPGADIVLNNFDHHRMHDTLIDVFARNIGATSTHQVPALRQANESLCAELLEIVRVANAAGLFEIARLAVAAQDAGLTGTPFAFAEPVRQAILESYRESNTRIAAADPQGEFADFACDARARHGADMTGVFPVEFALKLMAWQMSNRGVPRPLP